MRSNLAGFDLMPKNTIIYPILKSGIMVSSIQKEKAELFLKYHHVKEILVWLNSWDIGSSRLIEACGNKAIATL